MDIKLAKIKMEKQNAQMQKMESSMIKNKDEKSGIILRNETRIFSEDEILGKVGSREFVSVEKMDEVETRTKNQANNQSQGFYSIGVLSDVSGVITGKTGKKFCVFKISDLLKYDLNQVKDILTNNLTPKIQKGICDKTEIQSQLKGYTSNGYKQISVMSFGDSASAVTKIRPGTIIAVINPRLMPRKPNQPAD